MAECARQLVLEPYWALLNDVRSSSHYVRSLKIFFNSFSALINQLPSCFVLCLSSCVCLTHLTLLTFVYCAFDMIQLKRYICIDIYIYIDIYTYTFSYFQAMADVVRSHLVDNVSCTRRFNLRCPMCENPACAETKKFFVRNQAVLDTLVEKKEFLLKAKQWWGFMECRQQRVA